jgi:proteasome accessory factor B
MNLYRGQFRRLAELDRQVRSGKCPNCTSFARDYEVSRRTIARDVEFLKERGAPLEFDAARNGYRYSDRSWRLPALDLTEGELFGLLLAGRMAARFRGTPIAGTLDSLFDKIAQALPERVTIDPAYVGEQFSFHGLPSREVSEKAWTAIARALRGSRVLRLEYAAVEAGGTTRDVEPLHVACIGDEWYLVAHCRLRNEVRHFSISRVRSAKPLAETFEPGDFDPEEYFANRFGRFVGRPGKSRTVVVRFTKAAAPWVRERVWHPRQKLRTGRDGGVTLSFPAPALYEVKRWVLSWGAEAKVLAPKELRAELARETKAMAGLYGARAIGAGRRAVSVQPHVGSPGRTARRRGAAPSPLKAGRGHGRSRAQRHPK